MEAEDRAPGGGGGFTLVDANEAYVATPGGSWMLLESVLDGAERAASEQSELLSRLPSLEADDDDLAAEEAQLEAALPLLSAQLAATALETALAETKASPMPLASPKSSRETSSLLKVKAAAVAALADLEPAFVARPKAYAPTEFAAFPAYCLVSYTTVVFLVAVWALLAAPADYYRTRVDHADIRFAAPPVRVPNRASAALAFDDHYAFHPLPDEQFRGRRAATKAAVRAAYSEDAAAARAGLRAVEDHLASAVASLANAWHELVAIPPADLASTGYEAAASAAATAGATADKVSAYLANKTVDDHVAAVAGAVRTAAADARALPKAIAASALGVGGFLVGVPSFPGITDNLLVGLAGLALPFLDAKRDPPVATERL